MSLTPLDVARARVLDACEPLPPVDVPLADVLGCVLAQSVTAGEDVPPFDNTAVDGYAVRAADTSSAPVRLRVVGELAAGAAPNVTVRQGEAVRIMTGAPLPAGADAVVMVEVTRPHADGAEVEILEGVEAGAHVRSSGDDIRTGQTVFEPGAVLTAGHLGVLASLGVERVRVHPRPRVGVLSTGDELVAAPPGGLRPGQIRDANRPSLLALIVRANGVPVDLGAAPDDEAAIAAAVERGVADCDLLVTSGGVSVGDYDYVKAVLDRLGDMSWMQVAIKPAKPLAFGVVKGVPVIGLPGNPVSSMVSFELFARPALRKMMGRADVLATEVPAVAAEPLRRHPDGKTHFVRVVAELDADGRYRVRSAGGQGSHQLAAMAAANALAVVPDGDGVADGDTVAVLLMDGSL